MANKIKDSAIYLLIVVLFIAGLGAVGLAGWWLERKINYSVGYQSQVKSTIQEMVKPECLK